MEGAEASGLEDRMKAYFDKMFGDMSATFDRKIENTIENIF